MWHIEVMMIDIEDKIYQWVKQLLTSKPANKFYDWVMTPTIQMILVVLFLGYIAKNNNNLVTLFALVSAIIWYLSQFKGKVTINNPAGEVLYEYKRPFRNGKSILLVSLNVIIMLNILYRQLVTLEPTVLTSSQYVYVLLIAPLMEEYLFRYLIVTRLDRYLPIDLVNGIIIIGFTIIHFPSNLFLVMVRMIGSVLLMYAYRQSHNDNRVSLLVHIINNYIAISF